MTRKKSWKMRLALVLAMAMGIPTACMGNAGSGKVLAEETKEMEMVAAKDGNAGYEAEPYEANAAKDMIGSTVPVYKGEGDYLFAGWYSSEDCTKENRITMADGITTGSVYAKFVPAGVLSVKVQSTQEPIKGLRGDEDKYNGKHAMRFVSSVESLDYESVGFEYQKIEQGQNAKDEWTTYSTNKVYRQIEATTQSLTYNYSPKVVDVLSESFITAKMSIENNPGSLNQVYAVRAFWTTWDGVKVHGAARFVSCAEGQAQNSNTVNMSFKPDGVGDELKAGESLEVVMSPDSAGSATAVVVGWDGDIVSVKVTLDNRDELRSATKFTFKNGHGVIGSTIYRNLMTKYDGDTGTKDTSWYDTYTASNDAESTFVIATSADLYGLAKKVNEDSVSFEGKTVYLGADITVNTGSASGWESAPPKLTWEAIGTDTHQFAGTFDGQLRAISGLYLPASASYEGLFGVTAATSTIRNLKLTNSYFISSHQALGSIAGRGRGTFDTIYSDAIVKGKSTSLNIGGMIGQVGDGGLTMSKCQFAGKVTALGNSVSNRRTGGFIGFCVFDSTITDCMNTGTVDASAYRSTTPGCPDAGGYVGSIDVGANLTIDRCIQAGTLIVDKRESWSLGYGPFAGRKVSGTATIHNSVYVMDTDYNWNICKIPESSRTNVNRASDNATLISMTPDTLATTYGFDFNNVWAKGEDGMPVLKVF